MVREATLFALLLTALSPWVVARQKPPTKKTPLPQLVERHFAHWDLDRDDALDLSEVDHVIEDHAVRARQAALAVCLRHYLAKKGGPRVLPRQQLLKLVEQPDFAKSVERSAKHLETIDRELFLPHDPNLATFAQGRLEDCYLLAAIAAQVRRNPRAIRDMIHPEVTGGFAVVFGDGRKIGLAPLTDSELLLGAKLDSRHGSWLAVLEKAYGVIRKHKRAKKSDNAAQAAATVPEETLNFGSSRAVISLLTGRHASSVRLGQAIQLERVHRLLADATKNRRLICAETGKNKTPPGMVGNHAYAVLGYNEQQRQATVFNPWGNNFSPQGTAGMTNGYDTKNGVFTVPLDQFHKIFADVVYETGQPLASRHHAASR